jgi:flagellar basal body-associated protein FliL
MKRAVMILGVIALLIVAGVVVVAWFAIDKLTAEQNQRRTAAARAARWPDSKEEPTYTPPAGAGQPGDTVKPS